MIAFRVFLASIFAAIAVYTVIVIADHGLGLFSVFFGDIAKMGWSGQFNFDFAGFLLLSGFWLAWRNAFSGVGIVLGVLGVFLGAPFLTAYLFITSFAVDGDIRLLLLGPSRA